MGSKIDLGENMSVKTDDPAEYLIEAANREGIACASVSDGHVLIFTKKHLENVLATMAQSGQEKCIVFVKRQEFKQ